jgi:mandelamide amidase
MVSRKVTLAALLLAWACFSAEATGSARALLQTSASAPATSLTPSPAAMAALTATQAIDMLCSRNITAVDYVQGLFSFYDQGGFGCLNSWITLDRTKVLADAAAVDAKAAAGQDIKPLCGLPLAVKDSIDVLGYPTTGATPSLSNAYPPFSAPLIDAYIAANGIIMGKTNLAELSSSVTSINPNMPGNNITTPLNAYNQTKISGGSSGGSGVAVAAKFAPWSLCEDTGGSCRSPAMASGIFGFRPSLGCYNYTDTLLPATFTRDTVGSMGRTMDDLIMLDNILRNSGYNTTTNGALDTPVTCAVNVNSNYSLQGVRIGLPSNFGWTNSPYAPAMQGEMAMIANATLAKLQAAGAIFVPFNSSNLNMVTSTAWQGIPESTAYEEPHEVSRFLWRHNYNMTVQDIYNNINYPKLKNQRLGYLKTNGNLKGGSDDAWVNYLRYGRPGIARAWSDAFTANNVSLFLYPGYITTIPAIDATDPFTQIANGSVVSASTFFNIDATATATALAFPVGVLDSSGTPVGLQIAGRAGDDALVLSAGAAIAKVLGPVAAPPTTAGCAGCTAYVAYKPPTYNGTAGGVPKANETYTGISLTFNGTCMQPALTSYGKTGVLGQGMQAALLLNSTMASSSVQAAG